jgi:hypothetical protein
VSRGKRSPRAEDNHEQLRRAATRPTSIQRSQWQSVRTARLPIEEWESPRRWDRRPATQSGESFKCGHCKQFIGALPSGGHHRNHCPLCLFSRHVDAERSGDRQSSCRALMEPIGVFQRPNGEHVLVHQCLGCGFERFNRIAADDNFDLVLSLPELPARSARRGDS